jgi:Leucine-rich repeat (LRR) protein
MQPVTARLSALKFLNLAGMTAADYGFLAGLKALKVLDLMNSQIADLAPLGALSGLEHLTLWGTPISDVSVLAGLSSLKRLDLEGTQVTDLTPLAHLSLGWLDLFGIPGCSLDPLMEMVSLHRLVLEADAFADDDIKMLARHRPELAIVIRDRVRQERRWSEAHA